MLALALALTLTLTLTLTLALALTKVATAVAHHAYEKKIARTNPARGETVEDFVERKMYYPEYVPIFSKVHD